MKETKKLGTVDLVGEEGRVVCLALGDREGDDIINSATKQSNK